MTGWRLPTADPSCGLNFNCTGSEMGHLYYTELGNAAGGPITNVGPFSNVQAGFYWSGTEFAPDTNGAWFFDFFIGLQFANGKNRSNFAWAVRDGDVVLSVAIDIKPGDDSNTINLQAAGVVPVAILSSATFDALTVNPDTISLAGASVKMVGKSDKALCHEEDVNGDLFVDLVCKVETVQFIIEEGAATALLEASTFSGQAIRGEDTIRIVPD